MEPRLSRSQQATICSQLGRVRLRLRYKASVHGFTGTAFHQQCDTLCPTVSVGYNASGHVFGGYTQQAFSQTNQYAYDDQAFLFTFIGGKLLKYPVTSPTNAVRMIGASGPYFGEALVLVHGNQAKTYSRPGSYYNFNATEMHGNDLTLTECEVYQVEQTSELERPWRQIIWEPEKRTELMDYIRGFKVPPSRPLSTDQPMHVRVLLVGPVGAGKSSFFNSVNSVFRGYVTAQAMAGSSSSSLTTQLRSYIVKDGQGGKPLPIIFSDTMGLEDGAEAGLNIDDICNIAKGHLPDLYQFNPSAPLHSGAYGYVNSPALTDKIHCVAYVIDASKVSIMSEHLSKKLGAVRKQVNLMGIPQLVLLTKVDDACPLVSEDVRKVYRSEYLKQLMEEASILLGLPLYSVVPVKNYSEQLDLNPNCDILLLSAVQQMLRLAEGYFDETAVRFGTTGNK